jgi:hypothetical protein
MVATGAVACIQADTVRPIMLATNVRWPQEKKPFLAGDDRRGDRQKPCRNGVFRLTLPARARRGRRRMNYKYDLAVVYRLCPVMSRSAPAVFKGDKLLLSKIALESFKASLGGLRVKIWVLLDKCPPEYERLFDGLFPAEDLILERFPGIGNRGTLLRQFKILAEQNDAPFVYLAEDDYVYHANEFEKVVQMLRAHPEVDFVTPFNHGQYDTIVMARHRQRSFQFAGKTWKTVKATTGTFAGRSELFREAHPIFATMLQKVLMYDMTDLAVWLALTKFDLFNPWKLATWPLRYRFYGWSLFAAWRVAWRQILFGRRYNLWTVDPSLCTHLSEGTFAPGHDWDAELAKRIAAEKSRG